MVCACFPVKVEHSAAVMRLWKAWQCPLSPLGSPLSWRRTGQGPGHPHPSPEHSLHLTCAEPRRPLVGRRWECRLQGPRVARLPPEDAWWLLVVGHPDGHGAGWEQLPLSPRRGWWARTGRGPAPSAGKPRPSAEPTPGPRLGSQQVGWVVAAAVLAVRMQVSLWSLGYTLCCCPVYPLLTRPLFCPSSLSWTLSELPRVTPPQP